MTEEAKGTIKTSVPVGSCLQFNRTRKRLGKWVLFFENKGKWVILVVLVSKFQKSCFFNVGSPHPQTLK
jgi:hypothetical protein